MPARLPAETWTTITTEGGLLQPQTLEQVAASDAALGGLMPADFGYPSAGRLNEAITTAWNNALAHWHSFRITVEGLPQTDRGTTETREWVQKFLRELGYGRLAYRAAAEEIEGKRYPISHRTEAAPSAPSIHIVSVRQDLNRHVPSQDDAERRAPHLLMQTYLNASPDQLWGVVTNGYRLRILRDSHLFGRQAYVEVDLEAMFAGEVYADFTLVYRLLHRSRLPQPEQMPEECWLERWRAKAVADGTRARDSLRGGVEHAILAFGNGLYRHPDNHVLRDRLRDGSLPVQDFYRELLRLIYRLLFLMVAEERDLLHAPDADPAARRRYERNYSLARLRRLADRPGTLGDSPHSDLWRSLLVTFDAVRDDATMAHALGLEPLGGGLFDAQSCPAICDEPQQEPRTGDRFDTRPMLSNHWLLTAIHAMSVAQIDRSLVRVNYRDMDVEELGSVYESLLDQEPALDAEGFRFRSSNERKSTGSYYTPSSLVQELIKSALLPVLRETVERAANDEERAALAILSLKICDPACGSGHFLLAAARRLAETLARLRVGARAEPTPADIRAATRDVIRQCIYGVDKNPLAVDLCRAALWIESHEPGMPIAFLGAHIRRGDSLIGVFDLTVLETGIPDAAYTAITGDDRKVAAGIKKTNKAERPKTTTTERSYQPGLLADFGIGDQIRSLALAVERVNAMPERTLAEVRAKTAAWEAILRRDDWKAIHAACDLWTYAFFAPLTAQRPGAQQTVPTTATLRLAMDSQTLFWPVQMAATQVADAVGFFHWPLEFPEVFNGDAAGFDVVLGNPPWERVKLQEQEFFASRDQAIATAPNKAARDRLIAALQTMPEKRGVWEAFLAAKREAENASLFMRGSDRFSLTGRGDVNLYSVFAEQLRSMLSGRGRAGIIVPTGIATDDTNKFFFGDLVATGTLATLYDFENRNGLFPGVHRSYKFSLLTTSGKEQRLSGFQAGFFLLDPSELRNRERTFTLTGDDIRRMNPNTQTVPIFRTARDADLTAAIYRRVPVLIDEVRDRNPWGVTFKTMFHMSNDSHLFRTREQLEAEGYILGKDGRFRHADALAQQRGGNRHADVYVHPVENEKSDDHSA